MQIVGNRSYIVGTAMALLVFAQYAGWITEDAAGKLQEILLGGGIIFLRSAIANALASK